MKARREQPMRVMRKSLGWILVVVGMWYFCMGAYYSAFTWRMSVKWPTAAHVFHIGIVNYLAIAIAAIGVVGIGTGLLRKNFGLAAIGTGIATIGGIGGWAVLTRMSK
jgi:hypothetical protein